LHGGSSAVFDAAGNIIVVGGFSHSIDFGGGPLFSIPDSVVNMFVAKFDGNGNHLWSQRFENAGGRGVVDPSGNILINGSISGPVDFGGGTLVPDEGDIFLVKLDPDGNHVWSKRFDGAQREGSVSVATDGSGNVVIAGNFDVAVDFGGGLLASAADSTRDIFVAKFDGNGNHEWSKSFGDAEGDSDSLFYTPYGDAANGVATDGSGNVVVTGTFDGMVDFGGGALLEMDSVNVFVLELDGDGNHVWSKTVSSCGYTIGRSIAASAGGDVFVAGGFECGADFGGGPIFASDFDEDAFIVKLDPDGNHLWSHAFGRLGGGGGGFFSWQTGRNVALDGAGNVFLEGRAVAIMDFGGGPLDGSFFVAKFDGDGSHLWSAAYSGFVYSAHMGTRTGGDMVLTGEYSGNLYLGGDTLSSVGETDAFLAKFVENPNPVLITSFKARLVENAVHVLWDVWSDEDLERFTLYRRSDAQTQPIAIAQGAFTGNTRSYVDADVESGTTYHYELLVLSRDGDEVRSPVATVTIPTRQTSLDQNFPNPFNPRTTIEYTLAERSEAVVDIFDASGALVARLNDGMHNPGTYRVSWDGRNQAGIAVGSGVYFYRLEGAGALPARKMTLLK